MSLRTSNSTLLRELIITERPVGALKPHAGNARTHSSKQIKQIEASIQTFGFVNPVLIDNECGIIAGHGRVIAAKNLGMRAVPTIQIDHMNEAQRRAYIIADNKLAELAGWDRDLLKIELQFLEAIDLDFSIEVTGFSTAEIDLLFEANEASDPLDEIAPPNSDPPQTRHRDLWALGPHRLLCGDARDPADMRRLMQGDKAAMAITDPPYNVVVENNVSGLGKVKHRNFAMASGEMSREAFTRFLSEAFANLALASRNGAIHFVFMDWRHLSEVLDAGASVYGGPKNLCVWAKDNAGMGSFYRSQHELVFVFKYGSAPHINNFGLGESGRHRSNVWSYAGANSLTRGRAEELAMHPTVKPTALVADAIRDVSRRGDIVLDTFGGSGTTLIAAHKTQRVARLMEIDPAYCDVILERFEQCTGAARHLVERLD